MTRAAPRLVSVLAVGCVLIASGCGGADTDRDRAVASGLEKTSSQQLQSELPGNTLSGEVSAGGDPTHTYFGKDGSVIASVAGHVDRGTYRIDGSGRLCVRYPLLTQGADLCNDILKKGQEYVVYDESGSSLVTLKLRSGDPENLQSQKATP